MTSSLDVLGWCSMIHTFPGKRVKSLSGVIAASLIASHGYLALLTSVPVQLPIHSASVESPIEKQSVNVPSSYSHFSNVFCPRRAAQLPPHRPWDCAIDLFPGEPVPHGKIYPLSLPEQKAMEEYIEDALKQGYIVPSTSPAASSFFFVAKKDSGLRPCIDY